MGFEGGFKIESKMRVRKIKGENRKNAKFFLPPGFAMLRRGRRTALR